MLRKTYRGPGIEAFYRGDIRRFQRGGFAVEGLCVTMDPPAPYNGSLAEAPSLITFREGH